MTETPLAQNNRVAAAGIWLALVLVFVLAAALQPYNNGPVIRSDGQGYHVWTQQLLLGPVGSCASQEIGILIPVPNGSCLTKYWPGTAMVKLPLFWLLQERLSHGEFTSTEHGIVAGFSCLFGLATLLLMFGTGIRVGISPLTSTAWCLCFCFGTGLFHYATYDASFSHIYSAFGVALLLHLAVRWQGKALHWHHWAMLCAIVCWVTLIRSTNIFLLGFVGLFCWHWLRRPWHLLATGAAGVVLGLGIELAYVWSVTGQPTLDSYAGERFIWTRPMAHYIAVSYERGLLNYYPVMLVALALAVWKNARDWCTWIALSAVVFYAGLYGFWYSWPLGGGFGHRGFVELAPLVFIATALAWNKLEFHKARVAWLSVAGVSTLVTLNLMLGYWNSTLPISGTTQDVYWNHFSGSSVKTSVSALIERAH